MAAESRRLYDKMSEDKLSEKQKEQMKSLMSDNMKDTELMTALWILSSILKEYYGKKVIILIDEYDVPLDKAFENNYYNEMIILLRNMLKQSEYSYAAEPPVQFRLSHLSRRSEPL